MIALALGIVFIGLTIGLIGHAPIWSTYVMMVISGVVFIAGVFSFINRVYRDG